MNVFQIPSGKMLFLLLFPVLTFYLGTRVQKPRASAYTEEMPSGLTEMIPIAEEPPVPDRAELVMKALAQAYPDMIGLAEFRDGDWAVPLGGQWFYYSGGRLLPEELKDKAAEYSGLPFYNYAAELPPWNPPDAEYSARMREMTGRGRSSGTQQPTRRSQHFYEALWRIRNREESWERMKTIYFLGYQVTAHYSILKQLSLVEEGIQKAARTSSRVRQWVDSLSTVTCWTWRNIAGSESRSFHSYGTAIDLLPKNTGGLETYWQWTAQYNPEWWTVPYSKRYHPPDEVIRIFESFGFIWGGKWMVYDTMHFEYRPEIFILNNIPLVDFRYDLP